MWPWLAAATVAALGAGGLAGYMAGGGAKDTDTNTRYLLTFDEDTQPAPATIPTPTLE